MLEKYLGNSNPKLIVVAAGSDSPALRAAAKALENGLRASGKAALVMNAESIGSVSGLDDQSIVKRCANTPVDRVVVIRVFPDNSGRLSTAVISFYDKAGQSVDAFTVDESKPMPPKCGISSAGEGLAPQTADTVAKTIEKSVSASGHSQEEYDLHYIGFEELVVVQSYGWYGTGTVKQWAIPYEGKYKKLLEGSAFYEKIGRKDLVESYDSRKTTKTALTVGGAIAAVGGVVISFVGITDHRDCGRPGAGADACGVNVAPAIAGIAISLVGSGLMLGGILMNPNPIDGSEARKLADEYNGKLKTQLGLSEMIDPTPARRSNVQVSIAPRLSRNGLGLALGITF